MTIREMSIEAILNSSYYIIDVLPERVPADSPGQYFALEPYLRKGSAEKKLNLLYKLNCYYALEIEGERNPDPAELAEWIRMKEISVRIGDALMISDFNDTYMTLYNPDSSLLQMIKTLAVAEGLYVWSGEETDKPGRDLR